MSAAAETMPRTQAEWEARWVERDRRAREERASWPRLYPVVAELMELGFVPDAYGNTVGVREGEPIPDDAPIMLPPTKFAFPPGGIKYPHHAGGPAAGAAWLVWAFPPQSKVVTPDTRIAAPAEVVSGRTTSYNDSEEQS